MKNSRMMLRIRDDAIRMRKTPASRHSASFDLDPAGTGYRFARAGRYDLLRDPGSRSFMQSRFGFLGLEPPTDTDALVCTYEGFVEGIEKDIAYVTLRRGDETLYGAYPASRLASKGIHEGRRFMVHVIENSGIYGINIEAVPERELSPAELAEISREVDESLAYDGPDDDY